MEALYGLSDERQVKGVVVVNPATGGVVDRWVVVEMPRSSQGPLAYVRSRLGTPYGWFDLLSFLVPWRMSPGALYDWAMAQDGARIVPDDELRNAWRA